MCVALNRGGASQCFDENQKKAPPGLETGGAMARTKEELREDPTDGNL